AAATLVAAGLPPRLAPLLARRGVVDAAGAHRFLEPALDQLHDPMLLHGMAAAVERLGQAAREGECVAVVGDYDVDGVTATALLTAVLGACGATVQPILPHRLREGYGFQPVHVEKARALGCRLIVTVDCGTASVEAVAAAVACGIDVVITDHHLPGEPLPAGALLVNPRQESCAYPFPSLAGVGIALKLAMALTTSLGRPIDPRRLLRIACLGTIADLVPLVDENRVIAALGLAALADTTSPGLRALFRRAGVKPPFRAADVAFRLGPRINAAGRLDDALGALDLILTRDVRRAESLAEALDDLNRERQEEERRVVDEARELVARRGGDLPVVVAWKAGWHRGVLGIAAGRLARELHRPTILLAVDEGEAVGSGRSVPGIALHDFLARWRGELARFGGHDQAIGLTVDLSADARRLDVLRDAWEEAATQWPSELLSPSLVYEIDLAAEEVDKALLAELGRLEPHGQGNPEPLVRIAPLRLELPPRRFGKNHLSALAVGSDGGRLRLVGWGWEDRCDLLDGGPDGRFEAVGHLEIDAYHGAPRLRLADCRPLT
ncbi:MAG TPA: single-stranded-DNA-specific exonuclease RecJ, partial [Thermoanaerobaculia bacterium]|nr:single-stranded-DNA-specific exonuclease RecJ [Thermoanaerobaculia bacterium]